MSYYIAVDGGGTKTIYALVDQSGSVVDTFAGGGTNHENMSNGYDGLYFSMFESIHALLQKNNVGIELVKDAVFGLAGADHTYQVEEISSRIKMIGLTNFLVSNDAFLPIKSSTPFGIGIAYNAGTGISCTGINETREMVQIGGLGELTGDFGGGSHIAVIVYNSIYNELFLGCQKTVMTEMYLEKFGLSSDEEFYNSAGLMQDDPQFAFKAIDIFFDALVGGDKLVTDISKDMARRGALFIESVYRRLKFVDVTEVVLTGSIHAKVAPPIYIDMIKSELNERLANKLNITINTTEPVYGAVKWVKERNGL